MSRAARRRKLAQADALARERATTWRVYYKRATTSGVRYIVTAPNETAALRKVKGGYLARPVLPSSVRREIAAEVGLD